MQVLRGEAGFPAGLREVKPRVEQLYFEGEWPADLFVRAVAVVGSRRMTTYGQRMVERIVPELVRAGVTVVSGMMYGVDQAAHRACIEAGGKTAAVLGWGLGWRDKRFEEMRRSIVNNRGLVLSEWEKESPLLWMFPWRNRIVAGLSRAVLVIEAAEDSGSLITAEWAVKLNKKLLAVPGPATSAVSSGTNALIKAGQAQMVTSGSEVLAALNLQAPILNFQSNSNDKISKLLKMLQDEPLSVDELARKLRKSAQEVAAEVSLLELKGVVEEKEGKYYLKE